MTYVVLANGCNIMHKRVHYALFDKTPLVHTNILGWWQCGIAIYDMTSH